MSKFRTESGHCWITFENGYTLSMFNGFGSHTENYDALEKWEEQIHNRNPFIGWDSSEIEIAVLNNKLDAFATQEILNSDDDVMTIDASELAGVMTKVANYGKKEE